MNAPEPRSWRVEGNPTDKRNRHALEQMDNLVVGGFIRAYSRSRGGVWNVLTMNGRAIYIGTVACVEAFLAGVGVGRVVTNRWWYVRCAGSGDTA